MFKGLTTYQSMLILMLDMLVISNYRYLNMARPPTISARVLTAVSTRLIFP
jgi:hypothetical protein